MQEHATIVNKKLIIQNLQNLDNTYVLLVLILKRANFYSMLGLEMNASSIGVLKSTGVTNIEVYTKPIVNIVVTGDELVTEEPPLKKGNL